MKSGFLLCVENRRLNEVKENHMKDQRHQGLALYSHAGSGNHGCEAIADSFARQLNAVMAKRMGTDPEVCFTPGIRFVQDGLAPFSRTVTLMSNRAEEDRRYYPGTLLAVEPVRKIEHHFIAHAFYYAYRKLSKDEESFPRYRYRAITGQSAPKLAVSIGGDNYCYPEQVHDLALTNAMLNHQGTVTMLMGCSVEPSLLTPDHPEIIRDMGRYRCITARESISYEALLQAGLSKEQVRLIPDPAFSLPAERSEQTPQRDTVGINVSPLVEEYAGRKGVALESCAALIQHILDHSDMDVVLVPHVVWTVSNDRLPLGKLLERFESGGRVRLVNDAPAEQLKGVIAGCRFFIGARTHATIAAYSSCVPTLVIGYSVKSRGIARDLFDTEDHYVLPVQTLTGGGQLIDAFEWMREHEEEIRGRLQKIMPGYAQKARTNGGQVLEIYKTC